MAVQTEVNGIVLSSFPYGETDKRVILLTKELGKVTAFARGAKRMNSSLSASTRTFAFGRFTLHPGRSAYTLSKADISEYFEDIVRDMEKTAYGCYFLDLAGMFAGENTDETKSLLLCYYALKALSNPRMKHELVRRIFELKLLNINGLLPDVSRCSVCKEPVQEGIFVPALMQVVGSECRKDSMRGIFLNRSALYTLSFIGITEPGKLFSFVLSDETLSQITAVTRVLLNNAWEKEPESGKMLEVLVK